jgi:hypothetical protein
MRARIGLQEAPEVLERIPMPKHFKHVASQDGGERHLL